MIPYLSSVLLKNSQGRFIAVSHHICPCLEVAEDSAARTIKSISQRINPHQEYIIRSMPLPEDFIKTANS